MPTADRGVPTSTASVYFPGTTTINQDGIYHIDTNSNNIQGCHLIINAKNVCLVHDGGFVDLEKYGANANESLIANISSLRPSALGLSAASLTTREKAKTALGLLDTALETALSQATQVGACQQALAATAKNLTTTQENITGAQSTIRDADMAKTLTSYLQHTLRLKASQSMLAQANQQNETVLALLG